jgi:hypothetical protein
MAHAQKPDFVFRAKRTSPFKSAGGWRQFSGLLAAEVCASAVVMLDTPCSEVMWRVLATHCIRQFPLHFPSRASPCAITFQLEYNAGYTMLRGNVKSTGYPLHSSVPFHFPSRESPCAITFQLESNAGYTMFRGSVKSTGYPLHSPVFPFTPPPCVTVCRHISTGLYLCFNSTPWNDMAEAWVLPFLATTLDRFTFRSFYRRTWKGRGKPHFGRKNVALLSDHR